jgi:hypothetical protein
MDPQQRWFLEASYRALENGMFIELLTYLNLERITYNI